MISKKGINEETAFDRDFWNRKSIAPTPNNLGTGQKDG